MWHGLLLAHDPADPTLLDIDAPAVCIDGIVFWDEHHRKIILGSAGEYQHMISRNENGNVTAPENGGVFSKEKTTTSVKYPEETRGCFGVCIVTKLDKDGVEVKEGIRVKPFNYTGRKVVTELAFKFAMDMEKKRVLPFKGDWKGPNKGYEDRYPNTWEVELRKTVNKKLCSVNDLILHVITESTLVYAGTARADDFFIFHDGLTAWWTKESQEYIDSLGFLNRQIRCVGETNKGTRYAWKIVGDSPELCRGLDAYGFADFIRCCERHRILTSQYDNDDPRKFNFGTPDQAWHTMERCWTLEPTSDRIIADISGLVEVLQKIIEHKGCVIP
jgi:hypothetical protein